VEHVDVPVRVTTRSLEAETADFADALYQVLKMQSQTMTSVSYQRHAGKIAFAIG